MSHLIGVWFFNRVVFLKLRISSKSPNFLALELFRILTKSLKNTIVIFNKKEDPLQLQSSQFVASFGSRSVQIQ